MTSPQNMSQPNLKNTSCLDTFDQKCVLMMEAENLSDPNFKLCFIPLESLTFQQMRTTLKATVSVNECTQVLADWTLLPCSLHSAQQAQLLSYYFGAADNTG